MAILVLGFREKRKRRWLGEVETPNWRFLFLKDSHQCQNLF